LNVLNVVMDQTLDGHSEGKAANDIASWDLSGKKLNLAVVDLSGGARQLNACNV